MPFSSVSQAVNQAYHTALHSTHLAAPNAMKISVHEAHNLIASDLVNLNSDPFLVLKLRTEYTRFQEAKLQQLEDQQAEGPRKLEDDTALVWRTPTVHNNKKNPVWNCSWEVANIPASGFELELSVWDEDQNIHESLGVVHYNVSEMERGLDDVKNVEFPLENPRTLDIVRNVSSLVRKVRGTPPSISISIDYKRLSLPPEAENRTYTIGPIQWTCHVSPMIGRVVGTKGPDSSDVLKHDFQAVRLQLSGPVPPVLSHRVVTDRAAVAKVFDAEGITYAAAKKGLQTEHSKIYHYDKQTEHGVLETAEDRTLRFLRFVDFGRNGSVFTYVIMLDGQWRFTQTGKEFKLDFLSKHSMHSDVTFYIAYSGEFFVRRRAEHQESDDALDMNPDHYELVIDNESGTYRPRGDLLPVLKAFLQQNLPGLHITTMDGQSQHDELKQLKAEQVSRKPATRMGEGMSLLYKRPSAMEKE